MSTYLELGIPRLKPYAGRKTEVTKLAKVEKVSRIAHTVKPYVWGVETR